MFSLSRLLNMVELRWRGNLCLINPVETHSQTPVKVGQQPRPICRLTPVNRCSGRLLNIGCEPLGNGFSVVATLSYRLTVCLSYAWGQPAIA